MLSPYIVPVDLIISVQARLKIGNQLVSEFCEVSPIMFCNRYSGFESFYYRFTMLAVFRVMLFGN